VEGQNLSLEFRYADNHTDRLPDLAQELVRLQTDVILAEASDATIAAKGATSTIPIVAVSINNPVVLGLVANLAHPGGNVTGLTIGTDTSFNLNAKDLEVLKSALPGLTRVAVLVNLANASGPGTLAAIETAAQSLTIETLRLDVRTMDDLELAFAQAQAWQARGVVVVPDGGLLINSNMSTIAQLALRNQLPSISQGPVWAEAGLALTYRADAVAVAGRAAYFVDRILRGANPADMPVEQPTTFSFAANRTTLRTLGLTLPPEVAAQVTEWVE
jgi:putative ABC transport system substrate-binding protein